MIYTARYKKHTLQFIKPAGTSRGVYHSKNSWFVYISKNGITGVGECSLLKGLSIDDKDDFEKTLHDVIQKINKGIFDFNDPLLDYPAIKFGIETAMLDLQNGGCGIIFPSDFTRRKTKIVTNGLIWMGNSEYMQQQIADKLKQGFSCIKLKIGSLDWNTEKEIIKTLRRKFSAKTLCIRVDANGAYTYPQALKVLTDLEKLKVHSIEQPIEAGKWEQMAHLCSQTPVPIALDEELIGINQAEKKQKMLQCIKPQYIILKPGLLGGFTAADEWIYYAKKLNTGWWATSALEANIGLNAIAQWAASKQNPLPQGLGTGSLFSNNIESLIKLDGEKLSFIGLNQNDYRQKTKKFIQQWNNNADVIIQKTSGSTGSAKSVKIKKQWMIASAKKTIKYFDLQKGNTALLCLPIDYIAGKMMVVRAMVGNLHLLNIDPKGTPDIPDDTIHLAAMVPLQVQNLIDSGYSFKNIKTLIIGGAAINYKLQQAIKNLPCAVYATYGMTETCSHIALQRLNGSNPDNEFQLLDGFSIKSNHKGCLIIEAPGIMQKPIVTTDLVEILSDKKFKWLGRTDNVINSGGIKIIPEDIENNLSAILHTQCIVVGLPHNILGQQAVLVIEKNKQNNKINIKQFEGIIEKHKTPKAVYYIDAFPRNQSMKIDRQKTIEIITKEIKHKKTKKQNT